MRTSFAVMILLMASTTAFASDDWIPPVKDPLVIKECGECHMAFQAGFLPARSWDRMMDGLADHFGEDASLPADTVAAIRANLTANAGDVVARGLARTYMRRVAPDGAPLRITANPAFEREHRFPDRVWRDPKVVTRSNCPACHRGAERGWYEED